MGVSPAHAKCSFQSRIVMAGAEPPRPQRPFPSWELRTATYLSLCPPCALCQPCMVVSRWLVASASHHHISVVSRNSILVAQPGILQETTRELNLALSLLTVDEVRRNQDCIFKLNDFYYSRPCGGTSGRVRQRPHGRRWRAGGQTNGLAGERSGVLPDGRPNRKPTKPWCCKHVLVFGRSCGAPCAFTLRLPDNSMYNQR